MLQDNRCSMANAFRLAGCPRSTVRDFVAIAELKIVDHREHDRVIRDHAGSVKELEAICRTRLGRYLPVLANLRREVSTTTVHPKVSHTVRSVSVQFTFMDK